MKYLLILITMTISLTSEPAKDLFLKQPKYFSTTRNGYKYYCFDLNNMKILKAKDMVISDLFRPITNCYYSNMVLEIENQAGQIHLLESKLEQQPLKEKLKTFGIIGLLAVVLVETIIISVK